MKKIGFDSSKYLEEQKRYILERVNANCGRLYIECGGKLLFDYHAARCLPGFEENIKMRVFEALHDQIDIIICIYAGDIERRKMRSDFGISYDNDVFKMIDDFAKYSLNCNKVVITRFKDQPGAVAFKKKLEKQGIQVYTHPSTPGYPTDIDVVVSEDGYGKNSYIEVDKPIVLVTAPGPGSGKLATCLSQMYHEAQKGMNCEYSKFETFPVWNLPLQHPVNIAYEAATVDIGDVNLIDHFHLTSYGEVTINYSRDIEAFPLLVRILERISGKECAFKSPTDMGVNRIGFGIVDDEECKKAGNDEIIRRYFQTKVDFARGILSEEIVEKSKAIMDKAGLEEEDRVVVGPTRSYLEEIIEQGKEGNDGIMCSAAIELPNGEIVTAHNSILLHACSALLLNALKKLASIEKNNDIISPAIIKNITKMKRDQLSGRGVSLNMDEILICLAMSAALDKDAKKALECLPMLRGTEVHLSHIPSAGDSAGLRKLGMNVTSEPAFPTKNIYNPI